MNTKPTVTSALRNVARVGALGACLTLAACGQSQNWQEDAAYVQIGGEVSGLTGTVVLQNNGQDDLTVIANGPFTFRLRIPSGSTYAVTLRTDPLGQACEVTSGSGTARFDVQSVRVTCRTNVTIGGTISGLAGGTVTLQNNGGNPLATAANGPFAFTNSVRYGSTYAVTVRTQPADGQTCTVANGTGVATANVTSVAVQCAVFTLRPLPAIYTTGKAINYSAFRAGGPAAGEIPSDADVLQDLGLLRSAGFNLLRLFGADAVSAKILRLAAANFPEMQFHQGIFLQGAPASCVDSVNQSQIATGISLANQYSSVVTVSVGNETSFAANLPIACLASYVQTVRSQVTQPVTADDDYTFYAGRTPGAYRPDTVLTQIDFVSIHLYPISNYNQWNWQQTGTPAGPARAAAMMNASFANAVAAYDAAAGYLYRDTTGSTVTIRDSRPIVIGETGWKAQQSNPASAIETYAANSVNAKWYYDLMVGWEGTAGGPLTIFYFEAFDEAWKGIDDRWGLWDRARVARYALCGTAAGPVCNADLYQGAGYYP